MAVAPAPLRFLEAFGWGVATASYQIEGAVAEEGRQPSIWDTFSHTPGAVAHGHTGDVACDHYRQWHTDVELIAGLGVDWYRFSLAWPRLLPDGRGALNQAAVDHYSRLIEALLARDISPWVTLYHWDLPQRVQDEGGWPARDTAKRFADYAAIVHDRFGDRVRVWTTLNEPWCSAFLGYASGTHAPGLRDPAGAVRAAHHLLLGHGLAIEAMRGQGSDDSRFGITLNVYPITPASREPADVDAARQIDGLANRLFLDPVFLGRYPDDVLADLAPVTDMDHVLEGDLRCISGPIDLLGINYYTRRVVRHRRKCLTPNDQEHLAWPGASEVEFVATGLPRTEMGWEIDPDGLYEVLVRVTSDYRPPEIYVTENGAAFADHPDPDGGVRDAERIAYLDRHLRASRRALDDGVPLRGYFVWSLIDNFEWAYGYTRRFGVIYVDYATQRRTPKDSARWLAEVVRANRLPS